MNRPKYQTRTVRLVGAIQRETALAMLAHAPLDPDRPLELVLREAVKGRSQDQNAGLWAGPMRDIADQTWVDGLQFTAEVWAIYFKREFLPELDDPDIGILVKEGYRKWAITPKGDRVLMGSTTQLTEKGFARYRLQIEAWAANHGVELSAAPAREHA